MQTIGDHISVEPRFVIDAREAEQRARAEKAEAKRRFEQAERERRIREETERLEREARQASALTDEQKARKAIDEATERYNQEKAARAAKRQAAPPSEPESTPSSTTSRYTGTKSRAKQRREQRRKAQARQQWMMVGGGLGLLAVIGLVVVLSGVFGGGSDAEITLEPTLTFDEAAQAAQAGVESNAEWTPYIQEFDGVPMALVPVGCFEMGSEDGNDNEQPVHTQCIEEPFWIDVHEVTNEQYGELPTGDFCLDVSSEPDQPRVCVDWFAATAHCEDRGARLPTEAEWEYAARGPDSLVYPWGNEWNPDNANWGETEPDETFAVGSFPAGASWVDAQDMTGNVWEWTSSLYEDYPYDSEDGREDDTGDRTGVRRVLRGGSFL
jgi:hypothetical protein